MTQREKLIELILLCDKESEVLECFHERPRLRQAAEIIADYLLANGVVVLPCKVGDTVYLKSQRKLVVYEFLVDRCYADEEDFYLFAHHVLENGEQTTSYESFKGSEIGKTVFLTREEAEAALKKMEGEK